MYESGSRTTELDGWKAIATYLGVSVRTAQSFEKEYGLPVHRRVGVKARVYTVRSEVDEWKAKNQGGRVEQSEQLLSEERAAVKSASEPGSKQAPSDDRPGRRKWLRRVFLGGASTLGLAGIGMLGVRRRFVSHQTPARYRVEGGSLVVTGDSGMELWKHVFPEQISAAGFHQCVFADLDGDGRTETLFVYVSPKTHPRSKLFCFDTDGKIRWVCIPGRTVTDNFGRSFTVPYGTADMVTVHARGSKTTKVVIASLHNYSFPSQLAVLDGQSGRLLSEYWHRGHLRHLAVADLDGDGEPEILVGGVNDAPEYNQATLLVFDHRQVLGATPNPKGDSYFKGIPPFTPKHSIFFPKTALSRLEEFNLVCEIRIQSDRILVLVSEGIVESAPIVIYEFDYAFRLASIGLSSSLQSRLIELQSKGQVPRESTEEVIKHLTKEIKIF